MSVALNPVKSNSERVARSLVGKEIQIGPFGRAKLGVVLRPEPEEVRPVDLGCSVMHLL
jgi:hypothetical protein